MGALGIVTKELELEDLDIRGRVGTIQNYSRVKIGQNSSGHPMRFAVTQTPVENYQITVVGKTLKRVK